MSLFVKILGAVDIVAAAMLFLDALGLFPARWILMVGVMLVGKGFIFWSGGPVSVLDIIIGAWLIITPFIGFGGMLNTLFGVYLVIKGLYSFV